MGSRRGDSVETGNDRATLATGGALAAAMLGLVVARFRIARDLFAEKLPIATPTGIGVHLALLVGAVIVFFVVRAALRASARTHAPVAVAVRWLGGLTVVAVALSVALTATLAPGKPGRGERPRHRQRAERHLDHRRHAACGSHRAVRRQSVDSGREPARSRRSRVRPHLRELVVDASVHRDDLDLPLSGLAFRHVQDRLLPDAVETLAEVMQHGGYRTAGFVTNINVAPSFNFDQGFDTYQYLAPEFFFRATDSGSKLSLYSGMRLIRERFLSHKKWVQHYYQDAKTVDENTLPWFDGHRSEPFFTLIHYMDPHDPYFRIPYDGYAVARVDTPNPDPARAEELRLLYASNIEYMDGFIAKLVDELKAAKLYDDTVIALVADHGEEFHEHGGWWHGTTLYDEETHVPLIVKLPKQAKAGTRVGDLANLIDVMPTLLATAGLQCPQTCQGRDLFGSRPAPAAVYAQEDHEGNVLESIRTPQWSMIVANTGNPRGLAPVELYDLARDPDQQKNLASENPDRVAALQRDLDSLRKAAKSGAVHGVAGALDDAEKERLRALGYIQ
jgi:arylsulfatase A-like enzyme